MEGQLSQLGEERFSERRHKWRALGLTLHRPGKEMPA